MRRFLIYILLGTFFASSIGPMPLAEAQALVLPKVMSFPNDLVGNPAVAILKGLTIHPDKPLQFDFIVEPSVANSMSSSKASVGDLQQEQLKTAALNFAKYFLASVAIPNQDMWVNLSPYEKNRIIPESFGQTLMGRDLLAQDYLLKQVTASLIHPDTQLGKEFWSKVYKQAQEKFGTTQVPINTFNKVWIMPDKATVWERERPSSTSSLRGSASGGDEAISVFVVERHLKVMLEEDYLAMSRHPEPQAKDLNKLKDSSPPKADQNDTHAIASQVVRDIIIPALEKEVNEGEAFAQLREIYNAMILATWYKKRMKDSFLGATYMNKNKVAGVGYSHPERSEGSKDDLSSPKSSVGDPEHIYQQYLKTFKKGVFNFIKEEPDTTTGAMIPRKYFSGGAVGLKVENLAMITADISRLPDMAMAYLPTSNAMTVTLDFKNFSSAMPTSSTNKVITLKDVLSQGVPDSRNIIYTSVGRYSMTHTPWRAEKRMPAEPFYSVAQPFDEKKFNFNMVDQSEYFWEGSLEGRSIALLKQPAPFMSNHFLIIPERLEKRPQFIGKDELGLGLNLVRQQPLSDFVIFLNGLQAGGSVNHLHLQAGTMSVFALEKSSTKNLANVKGVSISRVTEYPANVLFFEGADTYVVAEQAYRYVAYLQKNEIAHSVVFRPQGIYVFPVKSNHFSDFGNMLSGFEMMGSIYLKDANNSPKEDKIEAEIKHATIDQEAFRRSYIETFGIKPSNEVPAMTTNPAFRIWEGEPIPITFQEAVSLAAEAINKGGPGVIFSMAFNKEGKVLLRSNYDVEANRIVVNEHSDLLNGTSFKTKVVTSTDWVNVRLNRGEIGHVLTLVPIKMAMNKYTKSLLGFWGLGGGQNNNELIAYDFIADQNLLAGRVMNEALRRTKFKDAEVSDWLGDKANEYERIGSWAIRPLRLPEFMRVFEKSDEAPAMTVTYNLAQASDTISAPAMFSKQELNNLMKEAGDVLADIKNAERVRKYLRKMMRYMPQRTRQFYREQVRGLLNDGLGEKMRGLRGNHAVLMIGMGILIQDALSRNRLIIDQETIDQFQAVVDAYNQYLANNNLYFKTRYGRLDIPLLFIQTLTFFAHDEKELLRLGRAQHKLTDSPLKDRIIALDLTAMGIHMTGRVSLRENVDINLSLPNIRYALRRLREPVSSPVEREALKMGLAKIMTAIFGFVEGDKRNIRRISDLFNEHDRNALIQYIGEMYSKDAGAKLPIIYWQGLILSQFFYSFGKKMVTELLFNYWDKQVQDEIGAYMTFDGGLRARGNLLAQGFQTIGSTPEITASMKGLILSQHYQKIKALIKNMFQNNPPVNAAMTAATVDGAQVSHIKLAETYEGALDVYKQRYAGNITKLENGFWGNEIAVTNYVLAFLDENLVDKTKMGDERYVFRNERNKKEGRSIAVMADILRKVGIEYKSSTPGKGGLHQFFIQEGKLAGLLNNDRKNIGILKGSPTAVLAFLAERDVSIKGLVDANNKDAIKPWEIEEDYWTKKRIIEAGVNALQWYVPNFEKAMDMPQGPERIRAMADAYRREILDKGEGGQKVLFRKIARLNSLLKNTKGILDKDMSPGSLLRFLSTEDGSPLIGLVNAEDKDALMPWEIEEGYWTKDTAVKAIVNALIWHAGFDLALPMSALAKSYRQNVLRYRAVDPDKYSDGQRGFFHEAGRLSGLMAYPRDFFGGKEAGPDDVMSLVTAEGQPLEGLIDDSKPLDQALHWEELKKYYGTDRQKGPRVATPAMTAAEKIPDELVKQEVSAALAELKKIAGLVKGRIEGLEGLGIRDELRQYKLDPPGQAKILSGKMKEVMALINSWVDGLPREFPSFDARQGVWVRSPKTANHGPVYDIKDKWSKLNQYMNVTELDWEEVFQASIQNYEHYVQMLEDILNFNPRADLPPNAEMLSVPYDIYIEFLNPAHQLFNSPAQVADPAMTALISPTHYDPMAVKSHMQEGLGHPFKAAFPASDPKLVEEVLRGASGKAKALALKQLILSTPPMKQALLDVMQASGKISTPGKTVFKFSGERTDILRLRFKERRIIIDGQEYLLSDKTFPLMMTMDEVMKLRIFPRKYEGDGRLLVDLLLIDYPVRGKPPQKKAIGYSEEVVDDYLTIGDVLKAKGLDWIIKEARLLEHFESFEYDPASGLIGMPFRDNILHQVGFALDRTPINTFIMSLSPPSLKIMRPYLNHIQSFHTHPNGELRPSDDEGLGGDLSFLRRGSDFITHGDNQGNVAIIYVTDRARFNKLDPKNSEYRTLLGECTDFIIFNLHDGKDQRRNIAERRIQYSKGGGVVLPAMTVPDETLAAEPSPAQAAQAMTGQKPIRDLGGIDMNSDRLDLAIKRDGGGMPLPATQQDWAQISINGLEPVFVKMEPVNLTELIGAPSP